MSDASKAYEAAQSAVREEVAKLLVQLDVHRAVFAGTDPHWGHVGDMTRILEVLREISR